MKHYISAFIILLIVSACDSSDRVKFEEPQPTSIKNQNRFGAEIQGHYIKFSNPNKTLIIQPKIIATSLQVQLKVGRFGMKIDSAIDISNDSILLSHFKKQGISARITKDTVMYSHIVVDTIFNFASDNILKKYKRNYFLNYQFDDEYWRVKKLKIRGDTLYFGEITPNDSLLHFDYANLDSNIAENQAKEYILSPSKREFKKLMRSKAFSITEKYIKKIN